MISEKGAEFKQTHAHRRNKLLFYDGFCNQRPELIMHGQLLLHWLRGQLLAC
jgi:hypothetical protein